jgi:hypothetical protein
MAFKFTVSYIVEHSFVNKIEAWDLKKLWKTALIITKIKVRVVIVNMHVMLQLYFYKIYQIKLHYSGKSSFQISFQILIIVETLAHKQQIN